MKTCSECNSDSLKLIAQQYTKAWKCEDCGNVERCYKGEDDDIDNDATELKGDMEKQLREKNLCPDCKTNKPTIKSNMTGNVFRCIKCENRKRRELGIPEKRDFGMNVGRYTTDFRGYWLKDGELSAVEDKPGFDKINRRIWIKNRNHEKDIMREMNCHIGERGENLLGHKLGYEKPRNEISENVLRRIRDE